MPESSPIYVMSSDSEDEKESIFDMDTEADSSINESDEENVIRSDSKNYHEESNMVIENEIEPSKNESDEEDGNIELFQGQKIIFTKRHAKR